MLGHVDRASTRAREQVPPGRFRGLAPRAPHCAVSNQAKPADLIVITDSPGHHLDVEAIAALSKSKLVAEQLLPTVDVKEASAEKARLIKQHLHRKQQL